MSADGDITGDEVIHYLMEHFKEFPNHTIEVTLCNEKKTLKFDCWMCAK